MGREYNLFTGALDIGEYNGDYSVHGVEKVLDEWRKNKEPLIDFLRTQEGWVEEELAIVRDVEYNSPPDYAGFELSIHNILGRLRVKLSLGKVTMEQYAHLKIILKTARDSFPEKNIGKEEFEMRQLSKILDIGQKKNPRSNQSWVKYIGQALRTIGIFDEREIQQDFAKLSDSVKEQKERRKLVLSVNPADYLLMSNGNSWQSCHRIDGGEYMAGTLSYLMDEVTMVFYILPENVEEDFYTERKINRALVMYDVETSNLLVSRIYPNKGYKELTIETVKEMLGGGFHECPDSFLWKSRGLHYRDYNYDGNFETFSKGECRAETNRSMPIGHDGVCIDCGGYSDEEESLVCHACNGNILCEICETAADEYHSQEAYDLGEGWYVEICESCYEYEATLCEEHQRVEFNGEFVLIEDHGQVCCDAFDGMWGNGAVFTCDRCGRHYFSDEMHEPEEDEDQDVIICYRCA